MSKQKGQILLCLSSVSVLNVIEPCELKWNMQVKIPVTRFKNARMDSVAARKKHILPDASSFVFFHFWLAFQKVTLILQLILYCSKIKCYLYL